MGENRMATNAYPTLSRPLDDARLRVVSFGAGVQSTTMLLMAAEGNPASQTLKYQDAVYTFEVDGRGDLRRTFLPIGETRCELNARRPCHRATKDQRAVSLPARRTASATFHS